MQPELHRPYQPAAPQTLEETGLSQAYLIELAVKIMFRTGAESASAVANTMRLSPIIVGEVMEQMRADMLIQTMGQLGADLRAEMRYTLTDQGRDRALEALTRQDYAGPAPVPLDQFRRAIQKQSVRHRRIGKDKLTAAFGDLVVPEEMIDRLGPAVNSGRSVLLYGPPGTGKSSIAHALSRAMENEIYAPYCFLVNGELVLYFDPTIHKPLPGALTPDPNLLFAKDAVDQRYVHCLRPSVATGAELTVEMLDLQFNPTSRVYQAPIHIKASNGTLIIDDLGRQRQSPQQLINRCVVPMEEGVDYFNLTSGVSFQLDFDTLMLFSTNFNPTELVDGAGLRRIYYKILVDRPNREDFIKIFLRVCTRYKVEPREDVIAHLLNDLYPASNVRFAGYHAPYLIDQSLAMCDFHGERRRLTNRYMDEAWRNLYVDEDV